MSNGSKDEAPTPKGKDIKINVRDVPWVRGADSPKHITGRDGGKK